MKTTFRLFTITMITIAAVFVMMSFSSDVEAAPKKLSQPKITNIVKVDKVSNTTKAYNRICMPEMYEANNVKIYRKAGKGKWKYIKTVKHYNGKYIIPCAVLEKT